MINICLALIALYVVFLLGGLATTIATLCGVMSALLHYFFLVFFTWTAIEAVYIYMKFVRVFSKSPSHFVAIAALVAWGRSPKVINDVPV